MATDKQINANRENALLSTGPTTPEGIANSSKNNFRHGLIGAFAVLPWEDQNVFNQLQETLEREHEPANLTEFMLVKSMAEHYWLRDRALNLQNNCLNQSQPGCDSEKHLALYMRYHAQHERAFYKALNELQKLRKQRLQEEIGFERQKQREAAEARKAEIDAARLTIAQVKADSTHYKWHRQKERLDATKELTKYWLEIEKKKIDENNGRKKNR